MNLQLERGLGINSCVPDFKRKYQPNQILEVSMKLPFLTLIVSSGEQIEQYRMYFK